MKQRKPSKENAGGDQEVADILKSLEKIEQKKFIRKILIGGMFLALCIICGNQFFLNSNPTVNDLSQQDINPYAVKLEGGDPATVTPIGSTKILDQPFSSEGRKMPYSKRERFAHSKNESITFLEEESPHVPVDTFEESYPTKPTVDISSRQENINRSRTETVLKKDKQANSQQRNSEDSNKAEEKMVLSKIVNDDIPSELNSNANLVDQIDELQPEVDEIEVDRDSKNSSSIANSTKENGNELSDDPISSSSQPIDIADESPTYPGGDKAMFNFIKNEILYPKKAVNHEVTGTVYIKATINTDGSLSNLEVMRGIGFGCDKEAIRVVQSMPSWKPGRHKGNLAAVIKVIPVKFSF